MQHDANDWVPSHGLAGLRINVKWLARRVVRFRRGLTNLGPLLRATSLIVRDMLRGTNVGLLKIDRLPQDSKSLPEDGPSPVRLYMDFALRRAIGLHCPTEGALILDVGCGLGDYAEEFVKTGVAGNYVGVDSKRRAEWSDYEAEGALLHVTFLEAPIEELQDALRHQLNFSFSLSVLHYLDDDVVALRAVHDRMLPGAYTVHCVPSLWTYFQFLGQGVRRYSAHSLRNAVLNAGFEVVDARRLGGAFSFLLHWLWITNLESGLMIPAMRRQRTILRVYGRLLRACLALDRWGPFMEAGYYVLARKPLGASEA